MSQQIEAAITYLQNELVTCEQRSEHLRNLIKDMQRLDNGSVLSAATAKNHQRSEGPAGPSQKKSKTDELIRIVEELVKRAGAPVHTSEILKAVKPVINSSPQAIYVMLSAEVTKKSGARLRRVGKGYYDIMRRNPVTAVPPITKEEFEQKVAEAKAKGRTV